MSSKIDKLSQKEWEDILENSTSFAEIRLAAGYKSHSGSVNKRIKARLTTLGIDFSRFEKDKYARAGRKGGGHNRMSLDTILVTDTPWKGSSSTMRVRLLKEEVLVEKCELCLIGPVWNNSPLTLELDHIDGDRYNYEVNNLRILCRNCHTQTPTFGSRNKNGLNTSDEEDDEEYEDDMEDDEGEDEMSCADKRKKRMKMSLDPFLNGDKVWKSSSSYYKERLLDEGILTNICLHCNIGPIYNDQPLVLQLDHINGDHTLNTLENLRILCPNCHTQTETYAKKRLGRKKYYCEDCDIELQSKYSKRSVKRCKSCSDKNNRKLRDPPSPDTIRKDIERLGSQKKVAEEYGVSRSRISQLLHQKW